jgi:hypothetical protein
MWVFWVILLISGWILGSAILAGAETMNCKTSGNSVKREVMQIPDVEGHTIVMGIRDGLAFFEDGEVATFRNFHTADVIAGKGVLTQGYQIFTFVDGSTMITSFRQTQEPDPGGKLAWLTKATGEILKGTGRFEGIKGSLSGTGKQFKPEKGDLTGKSAGNWTITYTLPPK